MSQLPEEKPFDKLNSFLPSPPRPAASDSFLFQNYAQPLYRGLTIAQHTSSDESSGSPHAIKGLADGFSDRLQFSTQPHSFGFALSKKSLETTSLSVAVPTSSKPPVAPGNYLEPHYHFFTTIPPSQMFGFLKQAVQLVSQKANHGEKGYNIIDTNIQENQFKIKCIDYAHGSGKTVFNIRIFSLENDPRYAVEFQRRQGCSLGFCNAYRHCLSELSTLGALNISDVPLKRAEVPAGPPTVDDVGLQYAPETIKSLLQMLSSECVDIQLEAVKCIVDLATDPKMAASLCESGVVEALVKASSSSHCDVHRCAVSGLAHLSAKCATSAKKASDLGGVIAAAQLSTCRERGTPQIQRESMKFIENVVAHVGVGVYAKNPDLFQTIDKRPPSDDGARLKWNSIKKHLQSSEQSRPAMLHA